jgi:hypothetical protein
MPTFHSEAATRKQHSLFKFVHIHTINGLRKLSPDLLAIAKHGRGRLLPFFPRNQLSASEFYLLSGHAVWANVMV